MMKLLERIGKETIHDREHSQKGALNQGFWKNKIE
jgi:hypothetical protein